MSALKKFHGRHHDRVNPYNMAVSKLLSDIVATLFRVANAFKHQIDTFLILHTLRVWYLEQEMFTTRDHLFSPLAVEVHVRSSKAHQNYLTLIERQKPNNYHHIGIFIKRNKKELFKVLFLSAKAFQIEFICISITALILTSEMCLVIRI